MPRALVEQALVKYLHDSGEGGVPADLVRLLNKAKVYFLDVEGRQVQFSAVMITW